MAECDKSTVRGLRETLELLLRTMKTLSLYQAGSRVSDHLETELHGRLEGLLDAEGPVELKVLQDRILYGDEIVYENPDRKESLAFLLSRDGIRSLVFRPGLALEELRSFVACLNRARVLVGGEDDLATLLWELDLEAIDYLVIDELADGAQGLESGEGLVGTGWAERTGGLTDARGTGGGAVEVQDLRPSARLPIEGARLSGAELEALHAELAEERAGDLPGVAVELAVELALLETDREERQILGTTLVGILDELLAQGEAEDFLRCFWRLEELACIEFASETSVTELLELVRHAMAREGQLVRFLEAVERRIDLADQIESFLGRLPDTALPILLDRLGRVQQSRLRRAVSDAVLVHGNRGPDRLLDELLASRATGEAEVIDELLHMVKHLPAENACPLVARFLDYPDVGLARGGVVILGNLRGDAVEDLLFRFFEKGGSEIRLLALAAMARTGNPALAARLLKSILEPGELDFDSEEIERALTTAGRLGGNEILAAFARTLNDWSDAWFPRREKRALAHGLIAGVQAVGTPTAGACLEELQSSRSRMLRRIAKKALEEESR